MKFTAKQIAKILNGKIVGNSEVEVNSLAKIEDGKKGDLCFLSNEKYTPHIYTTQASIVIVNNSFNNKIEIATGPKPDSPEEFALFYFGFDFLSEFVFFQNFDLIIQQIGISFHYEMISKGLIKLSDVIYFLSFTILFIKLTELVINERKA